jgi:glycosyltransferase involved in cell wall biosynthesis
VTEARGTVPRVSVIVPAYNYARFLPETIACLQRQTFPDWECILVDDGSTDNTPETIRRLAATDARLRAVSQSNLGLAAARNRGLGLARAPYVQFLDADDLLAADKLQSGVDVLESEPGAGVCYCNYRPLDSATGALTDRWTQRMLGLDPLEDFLLRWELDLCLPIHCALFRRDVLEPSPVFDESIPAKEDWLFWVELARKRVSFRFLDRDQAFYRMHEANMSQNHAEMMAVLVHVSMRILLLAPDDYRVRFLDASQRRIRRALDHLTGQLRAEYAGGRGARPARDQLT